MGHYRCTICEYTTGVPSSHPIGGHAPQWESCTCGSGAHPRKCDLHPDAYQAHVDDLNEEALPSAPTLLDLPEVTGEDGSCGHEKPGTCPLCAVRMTPTRQITPPK